MAIQPFAKTSERLRRQYSGTQVAFKEIKGVIYRSQSNQRVSRKLKGIVPQPSH